jgi:hypothetical protein
MEMTDGSHDLVIVFRADGKLVRLSSPAKWRRAISRRDIERDTPVEVEVDGRPLEHLRAGEVSALTKLFDELVPRQSDATLGQPEAKQTASRTPLADAAVGTAKCSPSSIEDAVPTSRDLDAAARQAMNEAYKQARGVETGNPTHGDLSHSGLGAASKSAPPAPLFTIPRIIGALAVAVLIGLIKLGVGSHPHPDTSGAAIANSEAPAADAKAPAGTGSTSQAALTPSRQPPSAIVGKWAPQGLTCADAYDISVENGVLNLVAAGQTSSASIASTDKLGVFHVKAADGNYTYRLRPNGTLAISGPGGSRLRLTRCAP